MQNCQTILESRVGLVSARFYVIADRLLSIETDVEWADRFAEAFLRGLHLEPSVGHNDGPANLRLKFLTDPPPPLPPTLQRFDVPGGVCYKNHQSYYLEVKGSRVAVGAKDARQVEVWLGDSVQARQTRSLMTVIAYALPAALRRVGLYDLHAAGLVEPESGCCFIFPGMTRSGKTSLTVRLASAGWHYLSDDLLVISEGTSCVEARGLRRPFQTSADTLVGWQSLRLDKALGVTIPADPEKRRLDPEILFPDQFATSARPGVLCFPVVTGANQSKLEKTSKAEAMMRLIVMCPWSNYDLSAAREHLRVLSQLVRQCKTFTLHAGRDIFDEPRSASVLLARHI
jgi:hypothetical protein